MRDYFAVVFLLFHCLLFVSGNEQQLFFDPHLYQDGDIFYVQNGTSTDLTCKFQTGVRRNPKILKRVDNELVVLVENGALTAEAESDKYRLTKSSLDYRLTLINVTTEDSSDFHCSYQLYLWLSLLPPRRLVDIKLSAKLDVIDIIRGRPEEKCVLHSDAGGVFFAGESIAMTCPHLAIHVSIKDASEQTVVNVISEEQIPDSDSYLFKFGPVDDSYDGKNLSCLFLNQSATDNYCGEFPTITVYDALQVHVSPSMETVPEGNDTTLTCTSNLHDVATFDWHISSHKVSFDDISIAETDGGTTLHVQNIQFNNSRYSFFEAVCTVALGTRTNETSGRLVGVGSIIETSTTPGPPGDFTTNANGDGGSDSRVCVGFGVVFILIVLTAVLCFVISIVIHFRLSKRRQMKHTRLQDMDALM